MKGTLAVVFISIACVLPAQTDVDALRFSRAGAGGTSRALAMGGAFGAVGADVSSAAFNPAGLALFRKGEFSFSGGLKFVNNKADLHGTKTNLPDLRFVFNNFGLALAWESGRDPESRHALAFTSTQVQNFHNSVRMSGFTNNSSIAVDMKNLAQEQRSPDMLNYSYERMAFETFLLDTVNGNYVSLLDTKRTVRQTRDLLQAGRQNDLNISYAFSYKDKYYIGASLGIPRVEYESYTRHYEFDDNDSMRLQFTPPDTYTHTFLQEMPDEMNSYYADLGAFHSLEYAEYFKTTGTGYNLKIGGIARVNEGLRLGFYYHTPTIYNLIDVYFNDMSVYFDNNPTQEEYWQEPDGGGRFEYRLITPSRLGVNSAFIFGKRGLLSLDYEHINYRKAQISSDNINDFATVNTTINSKYSSGHNLKLGGELNMNPIMLRAGYVMLGSPFGEVFSGDFVRHTLSIGGGIRPGAGFYVDLVWLSSFSNENYYLFSTLDTRSRISFSNSMVGATAGIRF